MFKIASIPGYSLDSLGNFGAALFQVPTLRSKEGDQCFLL